MVRPVGLLSQALGDDLTTRFAVCAAAPPQSGCRQGTLAVAVPFLSFLLLYCRGVGTVRTCAYSSVAEQKKSKIFSKLCREITAAAKRACCAALLYDVATLLSLILTMVGTLVCFVCFSR